MRHLSLDDLHKHALKLFEDDLKQPLTIDLSEPSLEALEFLLRHPRFWPAGFRWDFSSLETCAIGLAKQVWQRRHDHDYIYWTMNTFRVSENALHEIFIHTGDRGAANITATCIADRIARYRKQPPKRELPKEKVGLYKIAYGYFSE